MATFWLGNVPCCFHVEILRLLSVNVSQDSLLFAPSVYFSFRGQVINHKDKRMKGMVFIKENINLVHFLYHPF